MRFLFLALTVFGPTLFGRVLAADAPKPNIIVFLSDDVGWGEFGFQGNKQIPTPHIAKTSATAPMTISAVRAALSAASGTDTSVDMRKVLEEGVWVGVSPQSAGRPRRPGSGCQKLTLETYSLRRSDPWHVQYIPPSGCRFAGNRQY